MTLIKFAVHGALPLGQFRNYLLTRTAVSFLQTVKDHLYFMSYVTDLSTFALFVPTTLVQLSAKLHIMS